VHSDALAARRLIPRLSDRSQLLQAHLRMIQRIANGRARWFPTFNYDFPRSGVFDVEKDPSQVGPISEAFRTNEAEWRAPVPMFSVGGTGLPPAAATGRPRVVDPFGSTSILATACALDGAILWYGAPWSAATLIHHAESLATPSYRYDKEFLGTVIEHGRSRPVVLTCHVRPLGRHLEYAWPALHQSARRRGILHDIPGTDGVCRWASARALVDSWVEILARDPLGLLDLGTRVWVQPLLDRLGRRFVRSDFESQDGGSAHTHD
jgi:aminoglycoside N3'-acetyltransferase